MMKDRRRIAVILLWVSMVVLAMPVVPHHHHGHHEWICMRPDVHAGATGCEACSGLYSNCDHDASRQSTTDGRHDGQGHRQDDGHCDGDACCGHCCCHTGCLTHSVTQLTPSSDNVLPAPRANDSFLLLADAAQALSIVEAERTEVCPLYMETHHDAPSIVVHGLRAPPMVLVD